MPKSILQLVKTAGASWFRIFGFGLLFTRDRVSVLRRDSSWSD